MLHDVTEVTSSILILEIWLVRLMVTRLEALAVIPTDRSLAAHARGVIIMLFAVRIAS